MLERRFLASLETTASSLSISSKQDKAEIPHSISNMISLELKEINHWCLFHICNSKIRNSKIFIQDLVVARGLVVVRGLGISATAVVQIRF